MDNFFTSPQLLLELNADSIYGCGTVRSNRRGFPASLVGKNVVRQRGESKALQKGSLVAMTWRDKKNIHFLSTNCGAQATTEVVRRGRQGQRIPVQTPLLVFNYQSFMNGVDKADQYRMQYTTARKSKKWWRYIFWFLFDVAACNAFHLMRGSPNHRLQSRRGRPQKRRQLDFRMSLAEQLVAGYRGSRKRAVPTNIDAAGNQHWPMKSEKPGRCRMCLREGIRHEVRLSCTQCKVHLCVDRNCFMRYHSEE